MGEVVLASQLLCANPKKEPGSAKTRDFKKSLTRYLDPAKIHQIHYEI